MQIRGFYEFGHTLDVLDAESHGFTPADVAHVDRFWAYGDMHDNSAGFVLQLRDGRHAYAEFLHWHGFEQDEDFRIDVEMLKDGALPTAPLKEPLPGAEPWPPGGWSAETAHLDRLLLQGKVD